MKDFKKYFTTQASPALVYSALTNPFTIELWSGDPAVMSTEPGSEFSLWEGSIIGKNLEFIENKLVKQQWYFDDQEEESIVTIKIHDNDDHSSIELRHVNIPDEHYENIVEGWLEVYFASMLEFLADQ
jgi:activator of HSP90 ATPase